MITDAHLQEAASGKNRLKASARTAAKTAQIRLQGKGPIAIVATHLNSRAAQWVEFAEKLKKVLQYLD